MRRVADDAHPGHACGLGAITFAASGLVTYGLGPHNTGASDCRCPDLSGQVFDMPTAGRADGPQTSQFAELDSSCDATARCAPAVILSPATEAHPTMPVPGRQAAVGHRRAFLS